jgi:hypothetical protein
MQDWLLMGMFFAIFSHRAKASVEKAAFEPGEYFNERYT